MVNPSSSTALATSSSSGLTKTPTTSHLRRKAAAIRTASAASTARGLSAKWIKPIAQAPSRTASAASSKLVIPQIFTRIKQAYARGRGDLPRRHFVSRVRPDTRGDGDRLGVSVPIHGQRHLVPRRGRVDQVDHVFHPADLLAVDLCDDVAAEPEARPFNRRGGVATLKACLVCRAPLDNFVDEHPFLNRQVQGFGHGGRNAAAANPQIGVLDVAVLLDLLHHFTGGVDRHGKADADIAVTTATGLDL